MKVNKNLQPVNIPIEPHNRHIETTPKEALDFLVKNLPLEAQQTTSIYHTAIRVLLQALNERDIYYQALCDIESGKDVRMILERVLT